MPPWCMAMLWIISIMTTVLPTPAPPNMPILPPRGKGTSRSMTLTPVSRTWTDVSCSVNMGASRWIGHLLVGHDRSEPVHGSSDDVDDAPEARLADGHHDRGAGVLHRHAAHQTVGDVHGDAAHHVVAQVLGHLDDEVVLAVINGRIRDGEGSENGGKFALRRTPRRQQVR